MDIIDFLRREQISLARAQRASCSTERRRHEEQARHEGDRLRRAGFPHRPYPAWLAGKSAHS